MNTSPPPSLPGPRHPAVSREERGTKPCRRSPPLPPSSALRKGNASRDGAVPRTTKKVPRRFNNHPVALQEPPRERGTRVTPVLLQEQPRRFHAAPRSTPSRRFCAAPRSQEPPSPSAQRCRGAVDLALPPPNNLLNQILSR